MSVQPFSPQVYVDQPSVAQTVSILRGLRERYEVHHGVRISDSALVRRDGLVYGLMWWIGACAWRCLVCLLLLL